MAGVEQNRYKTNNGCIKHLPQTSSMFKAILILVFNDICNMALINHLKYVKICAFST